MAETDRVIVAGAGPVGMTAAAYLALHDIPVLVLEAGDDLATDLRASTWHPPTLDMLDFFDGIVGELAGWGLIAPTWQYRDRETGPVVTWDMSLLKDDTGHPYRIQTEQWKLTRLLHRRMADVPHFDLRFGHEVTGAGQNGDRAWVTANTAEGIEKFEGRWVIGGDGANSAVRRSLGIAYDGLTFPELFLTLSTSFEFRGPMPDLTPVNYFADPEEWLVLLRVVDAWRVLFPTGPDEDMEFALTDERVQERLAGVAPGCGPFNVVHKTHYRVHQRVADKYRIGRILLAGDAAHINNPLGGMGMNGGIQDAFSLCGKLVSVWRGETDDAVLDRYERQRRQMALDFVQQSTIRNRETLMETDPVQRQKRHDEMRRTADDPARAREFLLRSSMIAGLREAEAIP
ncbi:MAG: NAD(P)/FAD-dependent oxidoreductase [Rhodospirillaceae bacterium]|nr:NAD(P)/FAD-dependent oxidoreductase [Rhodospirillaceae bacterium]